MTAGNQSSVREVDYLVVGAGAMGMAFADVIFHEDPSATIAMVDRRAAAGGHWIDAYPFVTLHQPAAFYGVPSRPLGNGTNDLSSLPEILSYFDAVLKKLEASGRVQFHPMSDYRGDGRIVSTMDESRTMQFLARRRIVDATYMRVEVPATHGPRYEVDPDVTLIPPNGLVRVREPWSIYTVIGGGKTAIDAILFLLDRGVNAGRIEWIVPNDSWLWIREAVQPGLVSGEFLRQLQAIAEASHIDDLYDRLERIGSVARVDRSIVPTKWRCATVALAELNQLRTVENVVRLGRVRRISGEGIELEAGSLPGTERRLHIDCTANGLAARARQPLYGDGTVTLQSVFMCQQVFSAALIARVELLNLSDAERNSILEVVPHPEHREDLPPCMLASIRNMDRSGRRLPVWLRRCRLNSAAHEPLLRYVTVSLAARRSLAAAERAIAAYGESETAAPGSDS